MFRNPKPGFFQPLIPNFESNFAIPKAFHKHLEEEKEGKKSVTLRDKRGRTWEIKVENDDENNKLKFKKGWKNFCKDNELQVGDFLVFKHVGHWVFDVFVFDNTHCERQLSNLEDSTTSSYGSIDQVSVKKELEERLEGHNCCRLVVKPYSIESSLLNLPMKFARENGLNKRVDVTIIDRKGISRPMEIRLSQGCYPYIGKWASFHRAQNLKTGDQIILEVIKLGPKPILKLHVL